MMRDIRLSFSMPLARLSPPPFLPLNRSIPVFRALSVFLPRFVSRAPLTMSLYYALLTQRDQRDIPFRFPLRAGLIDKSLRLAIAYIHHTTVQRFVSSCLAHSRATSPFFLPASPSSFSYFSSLSLLFSSLDGYCCRTLFCPVAKLRARARAREI